jgi:hypothetical protein
MASHFQRNKIPAKIFILDPKPFIAPIGGVYRMAFDEPLEAISVKFDYRMGPEGHLLQTVIDDVHRRPQLWQEELRWYGQMVKDFTGS